MPLGDIIVAHNGSFFSSPMLRVWYKTSGVGLEKKQVVKMFEKCDT